jgi:dephospho-CoA kinase
MLVIGLTGGIGSGKSTVAKLFAHWGVPIIDCDAIALELVKVGSPALGEIVHHFGEKVLNSDQSLNRAAVRKIVFKDSIKRKWLEQLLHPLIFHEVHKALAEVKAPYCIVMIPLLIEANVDDAIQRVLVVDAPEDLQIERTIMRDNCSENQVKKIMKIQVSRQKRLEMADDIIINDSNLMSLKRQVAHLHQLYLRLSKGDIQHP